jgi:hypothetical protein
MDTSAIDALERIFELAAGKSCFKIDPLGGIAKKTFDG